MNNEPFSQSFWVKEGMLCAGHYPSDRNESARSEKLNGLLDCGIQRVINLMEGHERNLIGEPFEDYSERLVQLASIRNIKSPKCFRIPLRDGRAPTIAQMQAVLMMIYDGIEHNIPTYIHSWGGHGRTGTAICCYLIGKGKTAEESITQLLAWRDSLPRRHFPLENDQQSFIEQAHLWV